jgi:hypothetical protein
MAEAPDEQRAKDLYQAGALIPPTPPGARVLERIEGRERRRPAGNSTRLWMRVVGEDPFLTWVAPDEMRRKTVYVDGRFVRIDQSEKEAERKKHDHRPTPPPRAEGGEAPRSGNQGESLIPAAFRNIPTASPTAAPKPGANQGESLVPAAFRNIPTASPAAAPKPTVNQGESLIPAAFRNIPTAGPTTAPKPRGEDLIPPAFRNVPAAEAPSHRANLGEALIPAAFRDLPVAKAEPPRRPKLDPQPLPSTELPELNPRAPTRPGRPQRQRTVIRTPRSELEHEAPAAPAAPPAPVAPPPPPAAEPSAARPSAEPTSLDDLFSVPTERLAMSRSAARRTTRRAKDDES